MFSSSNLPHSFILACWSFEWSTCSTVPNVGTVYRPSHEPYVRHVGFPVPVLKHYGRYGYIGTLEYPVRCPITVLIPCVELGINCSFSWKCWNSPTWIATIRYSTVWSTVYLEYRLNRLNFWNEGPTAMGQPGTWHPLHLERWAWPVQIQGSSGPDGCPFFAFEVALVPKS